MRSVSLIGEMMLRYLAHVTGHGPFQSAHWREFFGRTVGRE